MSKLIIIFISSFIILSSFSILAETVDFSPTSSHDHVYYETSALLPHGALTLYIILRSRHSRDRLQLLIALGFGLSFTLDALHTFYSSTHIAQEVGYFIPQTWFAGRLIDGLVILLGFTMLYYTKTVSIPKIIILSGSITFVLFFVTFVTPLPNILVSDSVIHRPYDFGVSMLMFGNLFLFWKFKYYKSKDFLIQGLMIFIMISAFTELVISTSVVNFDTPFSVAHILKIMSYYLMVHILLYASIKNSEELKKTDVQKAEFTAMASHELKTPLVPIKGYLEMLLEPGLIGNLNQKQTEILSEIYSGSEKIEKITRKLLLVYRLDVGQIKWNIEKLEIKKIMDSVYNDNQSLMAEKNITFSNLTKLDTDIYSDLDSIKEVFSNLIQNSVDFVSENGKIEIDAISDSKNIVFSVKDNGIGIPKINQEHLFKKFYQVDTSVTRKHGGTGVGLSICKGLVEGLGGQIWVDSDINKGAMFYFSFPNNIKEKKD